MPYASAACGREKATRTRIDVPTKSLQKCSGIFVTHTDMLLIHDHIADDFINSPGKRQVKTFVLGFIPVGYQVLPVISGSAKILTPQDPYRNQARTVFWEQPSSGNICPDVVQRRGTRTVALRGAQGAIRRHVPPHCR
jgi:hypothetical protein